MTIRPILFSAPMVRALLAGTKTQTRRIMKPQPPPNYPRLIGPAMMAPTVKDRDGNAEPGPDQWMVSTQDGEWGCPIPFAPGDLLWVRETWGHDGPCLDDVRRGVEAGGMAYGPYYMADADWFNNATIKARPSIHMPRWASRLTLEVTQVRVERLQDITEDDARAEGIARSMWPGGMMYSVAGLPDDAWRSDPRDIFRALWTRIYGPDAWAANPWVVAVSFTVHRCNVDQMGPRT